MRSLGARTWPRCRAFCSKTPSPSPSSSPSSSTSTSTAKAARLAGLPQATVGGYSPAFAASYDRIFKRDQEAPNSSQPSVEKNSRATEIFSSPSPSITPTSVVSASTTDSRPSVAQDARRAGLPQSVVGGYTPAFAATYDRIFGKNGVDT